MARKHLVKVNTLPCPKCGQLNEYNPTAECKNVVGCEGRARKRTAAVALLTELTGIDITQPVPTLPTLAELIDGERPDCEDGRFAVEAVVNISCRFCGFNIGENRADKVVDGFLTCESCGGRFAVPASSIHDAQHACLIALGEA